MTPVNVVGNGTQDTIPYSQAITRMHMHALKCISDVSDGSDCSSSSDGGSAYVKYSKCPNLLTLYGNTILKVYV